MVSYMNDSIRITGICGTMNADSTTRRTLSGAAEYSVETDLHVLAVRKPILVMGFLLQPIRNPYHPTVTRRTVRL
jgi:hypothetical protein